MFPKIFRELQIAYTIWEGGSLRLSLALQEEPWFIKRVRVQKSLEATTKKRNEKTDFHRNGDSASCGPSR
jgi:hypothetical protein